MVKSVRLGKSELFIHPIGLGTNAVGGHNLYPNLNEDVGKDVVRTALSNGMNFLDTAFRYGDGRSEELIGEVVNEYNRSDVVIATKASHKYGDDGVVHDNSPAFLKQAVEESLERLQTDYIDLFYIHYPDTDTPKYEAVGALKELKDQGKIRAIGVSNFSLEQLKEANKDGYVDVFQGEYNLINRRAEHELFPYTLENQVSFIPYFPLASGLLAGRYTKHMKFNDLRANKPHFQGDAFESYLKKVEQLRPIAEAKNAEVAHVVLAYYLTRPGIDAIIPGAKHAKQVLSNLTTLKVNLTAEEIEKIKEIF